MSNARLPFPALLAEANACYEQGRLTEARGRYQALLRAQPACFEAVFALGLICQREADYTEAEAYFRRALRLRPNHAEICNSLGWVLRKQGKWVDALLALRAALSLHPDFAGAHANLGLVLLQLGEFTEGWREYEYRLLDAPTLRPALPFAQWQGEPAPGKRFLLIGEQGLGDVIQFLRYASLLAEQGATVDVLLAQPLVRIAQSVAGVRRAFSTLNTTADAYDYQCQLLSLPYRMNTRLDTIPARAPYMSVTQEQAAYWRQDIARHTATSALTVGLTWSGGQRPQDEAATVFDQRRSLRFSDFLPLLEVAGVRFFSLQLGKPALELTAAQPAAAGVIDLSAKLQDFVDTAAALMNLDLLITCDTSVAHLAGALNRPVWVINRHDRCWRWLIEREDSPWYPSMRLFTQPSPGDWAGVMAQAHTALAQHQRKFAKP